MNALMQEKLDKILSGESVREILLGEFDSEQFLFEMSNVLGRKCKVPGPLHFSFFFSRKDGNKHGIRAKIKWNPEKFKGSEDGNMELHGSYDYFNSIGAAHVMNSDIEDARDFFRSYKVLFAAVWEDVLDQSDLYDYFTGHISFEELLRAIDIPEQDIDSIGSVNQLEIYVRNHALFNMND